MMKKETYVAPECEVMLLRFEANIMSENSGENPEYPPGPNKYPYELNY